MTTKTAANFNWKRGYPSHEDDVERPMSHFQRRTLTDLIYGCISHPDEIVRRLAEIEGYNFYDAADAIEQYKYASYK